MRAATLANYPEVARRFGLDPSREMRSVGLRPEVLDTPDLMISSDAVIRLLEQAAQKSGERAFGMRMAEGRQFNQLGIAGLLLRHQLTPRDALGLTRDYLDLLNPSLAVRVEEHPPMALVRVEVMTDEPIEAVQGTELATAAIVQAVRAVIAPHWRPTSVLFRHAAPPSQAAHFRVLKCPCLFGEAMNGFEFPASDLDLINPSADTMLANYARSLIEIMPARGNGSTVTEVRRLIHLYLPMGRASIKLTAQTLGMNERSLHRALAASGETFTTILAAVRRELALRHLQNPRLPIGQIAHLLGYANHAAFTRWFAAEFGHPPSRSRTN